MPRSRPGALAYPDTRYSAPALPDLSVPKSVAAFRCRLESPVQHRQSLANP